MPHIVDDDLPDRSKPLAKWKTKNGSASSQSGALPSSSSTPMRMPRPGFHCSNGPPARAASRSNTAGPASSTMCRSVSTKSWIMVGAASATAKLRASLPDASIWWNWTTGSFTL